MGITQQVPLPTLEPPITGVELTACVALPSVSPYDLSVRREENRSNFITPVADRHDHSTLTVEHDERLRRAGVRRGH